MAIVLEAAYQEYVLGTDFLVLTREEWIAEERARMRRVLSEAMAVP